jgi:putative ABC transport system permease protein
MKGTLRARMRSYGIRNALVIFQFFISSGLIVATLVVYQQLRFVQRVDVGFDKNNIINLLHTRNLGSNGEAFKQELLALPFVESASYCNRLPPFVDWQSMFRPSGMTKDFSLIVYEMDYDHLATMGYTMVSGRFFDRKENDSLSLIVNETAARKMGLRPDDKKVIFTTYDRPSGRNRNVIGIVKDFNFQSLKMPVQPMAIVLGYEPNWEMAIRLKSVDHDAALQEIEGIYHKYASGAPFEYSFVNENFEVENLTEKRIGLLFILFTVLAIIIACLGLFGLASFTAEQQRKAIGIRKVLGASPANIIRLLNKEFLFLVLIANVMAWPVSGWLMHRWLSQFAYHADIAWWIFLIAGLITFFIAFATISSKAFQAASGNPVDSLRNE